MQIALECAVRGRGNVEPNPMVGAVLVRDGLEIARGHHQRFGGPHAEVEAIAAAVAAGADLRGATLYVTLEPCCHHGKKTPPCTEAIVPLGLARVVVAMVDPDEHVAGQGIDLLRGAGIDVTVGVCQEQARLLLEAYTKLRTQHRPWVIAKWAQTADGFLALPASTGRWISNEQSRAHAHELRSRCDGILVGVGTVLTDDPRLTNRSGQGKDPTRIVLDSSLRTPLASQLVASASQVPLIIATADAGDSDHAHRAQLLRDRGVEILPLPGRDGDIDLKALLDELGRRQWTYLLVEGGKETLVGFLHAGLADEVIVYRTPLRLGAAGAGLPRLDIEDFGQSLCKLTLREQTQFDQDEMFRFGAHSKNHRT